MWKGVTATQLLFTVSVTPRLDDWIDCELTVTRHKREQIESRYSAWREDVVLEDHDLANSKAVSTFFLSDD